MMDWGDDLSDYQIELLDEAKSPTEGYEKALIDCDCFVP